MSTRRFFVPRERIRDGVAFLPADQVHHLRRVLRLNAGDVVEVFDGEGAAYVGRVEILGPEARIGQLQSLPRVEPQSVKITLAPALIRGNRFDWMLQKATELGADEIIPLETRFSGVRISGCNLDSRLERWRRIAREASQQCGRISVPQIRAPIGFGELLSLERLLKASRVLFYERAAGSWQGFLSSRDRIVLCTGPEGGWEAAEVEAAEKAGFDIFGLGWRTLRAETAALAALAIIQFSAETKAFDKLTNP